MHPDVCDFVSEQFYEARLTSHTSCGLQGTGAGTGLRWLRAEHRGCSTSSPEEARLVAETVRVLIGETWTDASGATRPLTANDFMVVAPYNDQVTFLRETLDDDPATAGVRVGTVDKFQGQQAHVVVYSMGRLAVTAGDVPFLYEVNRVNVALSRARLMAIVVSDPKAVLPPVNSPEQLMMASRFAAAVAGD